MNGNFFILRQMQRLPQRMLDKKQIILIKIHKILPLLFADTKKPAITDFSGLVKKQHTRLIVEQQTGKVFHQLDTKIGWCALASAANQKLIDLLHLFCSLKLAR